MLHTYISILHIIAFVQNLIIILIDQASSILRKIQANARLLKASSIVKNVDAFLCAVALAQT